MKSSKKNNFDFDFGFLFIVLLLLSNLLFLLNSDLVLILVLISLFYLLALFLIEFFKTFIENEKANRLKSILFLLADIKINSSSLENINSQITILFSLIVNNIYLKFFNNIFYRCVEIFRSKNYLSLYIFEFILFFSSCQQKLTDQSSFNNKEDFLNS